MPIDDESFYNVLGEEISRSKIVDEMINYYNEKLQLGETKITDFNEGSEIRNLLEAIAVDLYVLMEDNYESTRIAFISTSYGEWLDLHGANPLINIERETGVEASGLLKFSIPSILTDDVVIPEETVVASNDTGLEYLTDVEATIPVGEISVEVPATCLTVGADGNCDAGSLTILDEADLDQSVTVTNETSFTGGVDYEEDDDYRERLLSHVKSDSFGSIGYYKDLAESIEEVHDVLLVDAEGYTKKVLVNGFTKPTSDDALIKVLTAFTNTENIVLNHNFTVGRPEYSEVSFDVDLEVEYLIDNRVIEDVISKYFDGGSTDYNMEFDGLSIGESLTRTGFYAALEQIDGIVSIVAKRGSPSQEITTISPTENGVLKMGTIGINQTIVG